MNSKKPFTLLEILICFSILLTIGSVSTYWVYKKLQRDRFFSEVERFEKSINLCQKIARIRNEDLQLSISQVKKNIYYTVEGRSLLPTGKNLIRNAELFQNETNSLKIFLDVYPNSIIEPKCLISIVSRNKSYKKEIIIN
ncbi:MAG: type II secretion system protein [Chlamydiota bacterium]